MKRIIAVLLSLCLLALLCACGEKEESAAPAPAPAETQTQAEEKKEAPEAAAEETKEIHPEAAQEEEQKPAEEPAEPTLLETALTFVDKDAAELVAAIGEPLDKVYEESCSGPGDDGVWTYDGLTVFTYTENGVETVVDAE